MHPMFTGRAVEKVISWLDREESLGDDVKHSLDQETEPFEEQDFTQYQLVDIKSGVDEDDPPEPVKIVSNDPVVDGEPVTVEEGDHTLPTLVWQQVEVRCVLFLFCL